MHWPTTKRSWAAESICSIIRIASNQQERLQNGASRVAVGDLCYVDIQLGNFGTQSDQMASGGPGENRASATFNLHTPDGAIYDLRRRSIGDSGALFAVGPDANGRGASCHVGASFAAESGGVYIADARRCMGAADAAEKSYRCAKAVIGVAAGRSGENGLTGFDRAISQLLEVVPLTDPTNLHVGDTLTVQILFKGVPLPDACVTVIPRGKLLPRRGVENRYDLMTDREGKASYTFDEANYHVLVVHLETHEPGTCVDDPGQKAWYTGDLTVMVKTRHTYPVVCSASV